MGSDRETDGTVVHSDATVGVAYREGSTPPEIGPGGIIRSGTTLYDDVVAGRNLTTGHGAVVREETRLGNDVLVGTHAVIEGASTLGDGVSLQTGAYLPRETTLGDRVFLGPHACLTNDRYPVRGDAEGDADLVGPTLDDDVTVGANATILPGVTVGQRAFVAAGAVVVDDVPPATLATGVPATHRPLPPHLQTGNDL
jgi:acetyltransferase-like isoleucine patch superfamily enzyme